MVMKESLFATPQSWSELLNWLNLHPKDDVKPLTYAAVLGYNFVINQLNADNPTIPFPKYRITSSDLPKFDNYQEILQWITEFPEDNHVWLLTAQAMGQNFAVHCFENGTLMDVATELASATHEEHIGAMLFPLAYDSSSMDISTSDVGSIYILARDSGNIVKVGETSRDPKIRGSEYIAEYKLVGFSFYKSFSVPMEARKDIEKIAHQKLSNKRLSWDNTSGAREIFECSTDEAEQAVLEAIGESEAAKVAIKEERERQMLERAEYRFNNELKFFIEGWMKKWDASDESKQLTKALSDFIETNTFDKAGERGVFQYFWLVIGWFFKIAALLQPVGMLRHIFFDPFEFTFLLMGIFLTIVSYGVGWFFLLFSETLVPDQDTIAKRKALEQEIENQREFEKNNADAAFRKEHTINEFY